MSEKKEEKKVEFHPGVGVDIGTCNLVITRQTKDNVFINRYHRNILFQLPASDESNELLQRGDYLYVKADNKFYIVGEDALKLAGAIGKSENLVRPMQNGMLNPNISTSSDLLFFIIKSLCGEKLFENEPLRFSIPANDRFSKMDNRFHQMVLANFFNKMGYAARPLNEAVALAFDCNPILKEEGGEEIPLSGMAISFGGGMINCAILYKGMELDSFSITSSGDAIDVSTAQVTGVPLATVVKIKEKKLDLNKIDPSDRVQQALSIYYDEMIERVVKAIGNNFKDKKSEMEGKMEVVVAGGTSLCNGFISRLEEGFKKFPIPFDILKVRHSEIPFYSVSNGCCIRSRADYAKSQKQ
jgi:actin-like ATPase involved in cell morphogenesis